MNTWIAEHVHYPQEPYQYLFEGKPTRDDIEIVHKRAFFAEEWVIKRMPLRRTERTKKARTLFGIL